MKKLATIRIPKEKLRPKPRMGVHPTKVVKSKVTYRRKPKHSKRDNGS